MLTLADLCEDTAAGTLLLEPAESAVYGFIFFESNLGHVVIPSLRLCAGIEPALCRIWIIVYYIIPVAAVSSSAARRSYHERGRTTILISLPFTYMTLTVCMPSVSDATRGSAMAAASASSC
jgi:hypothetical protein